MGKPLSFDERKEIIDTFEQAACQVYLDNEKLQISPIAEKTHDLLDFEEKPSVGTIKQMFSPGRHSYEALPSDLKEQVNLVRDFIEPKEGSNAFSDNFKSQIVKVFDEITQQHIKNKDPLTLDSIGEEVIEQLKDEEIVALNTIKNMFNPNNPSFNSLSRNNKHKVRRLRRNLKLKRKGIKTLTPEIREDIVSLAEAVYSLKPRDFLEDLENQEKSKVFVREIARMIELALEEEHGPLDNSIRYMVSGIGASFDAMSEENKGRLQLVYNFMNPQSHYTDEEISKVMYSISRMIGNATRHGEILTITDAAKQIQKKKGIPANTVRSWFVIDENLKPKEMTKLQKKIMKIKSKLDVVELINDEKFAEAMNIYEGIRWGVDKTPSRRSACAGAALSIEINENTFRYEINDCIERLDECNKGRIMLDLPLAEQKEWSDEEKEHIINKVSLYLRQMCMNVAITKVCEELELSDKQATVEDFLNVGSRGFNALPDYLQERVCTADLLKQPYIKVQEAKASRNAIKRSWNAKKTEIMKNVAKTRKEMKERRRKEKEVFEGRKREAIDTFEQIICQKELAGKKLVLSELARETSKYFKGYNQPSESTIKNMFVINSNTYNALDDKSKKRVKLIRNFISS